MSEPLCLAVTLLIHPGGEARAAACLRELARLSRLEPGCLAYNPHRSLDNPRQFYIYELYRDEAALEAHRQTDHFAAHAVGELYTLCEERSAALFGPAA